MLHSLSHVLPRSCAGPQVLTPAYHKLAFSARARHRPVQAPARRPRTWEGARPAEVALAGLGGQAGLAVARLGAARLRAAGTLAAPPAAGRQRDGHQRQHRHRHHHR